jgi:signal transduction histidine kinase/CheY-like chemotaxis protein
MTRSWRPGLRVQVLLAGVAAVLVVVLASAAATAWYFMDSQYKAHHSRALAIADGLAVQLERILALDIPLHDLEGFDAQCDEALARHGGLSYALVADLQGQLLFRSDRAAVAGPGMPSKVDLNEPHQHAFSADESEHPVSSPVRGADGLAVATVVVAFPLAALQADRNGLLLRVAGVGTLALLVVLALLWMGLSRVLVGPLDRVVEAVARLRAGDRQARVQLPAGPAGELALLADGFNGLAQTVVLREQELLSARDAAEQASRAKSQFLAVMSHELRTPLNAVLGMAEVLARSPLDARQQRLLGQIRTSGRLLADIIADLLDLSTIEAGRLRVAELPFRLRDTVADAVERFRAEADRRGLWLTLDLDPALPERVLGDALRVQQVLGNLLSNALKFTEQGGVRVTVSPSGPALRVAVADTGIGIDEEFLPHVYEAFRQADGSMSRRFGGSGLGLSIARALCDAMGGRIDVASRPGRGTTFWFEVPLREPDAGDSAPAPLSCHRHAAAGGRGAGTRRRRCVAHDVLLVEDNEGNREFVQQCLAGARWRLTVAREGTEGLARLYDRRYDVVLLDWQLPGIDGCRAAEGLARAGRARRLAAHPRHCGHRPCVGAAAPGLPGRRCRRLPGQALHARRAGPGAGPGAGRRGRTAAAASLTVGRLRRRRPTVPASLPRDAGAGVVCQVDPAAGHHHAVERACRRGEDHAVQQVRRRQAGQRAVVFVQQQQVGPCAGLQAPARTARRPRAALAHAFEQACRGGRLVPGAAATLRCWRTRRWP